MKAVLSLPDHWRQNSRYAEILDHPLLTDTGQAITRGLAQSAFIYRQLPAVFPIEIEWAPKDTDPKLAGPILFVEAEGTQSGFSSFDLGAVREKLCLVLRDTKLRALIPDCELCLRVVFDSWGHLGT